RERCKGAERSTAGILGRGARPVRLAPAPRRCEDARPRAAGQGQARHTGGRVRGILTTACAGWLLAAATVCGQPAWAQPGVAGASPAPLAKSQLPMPRQINVY